MRLRVGAGDGVAVRATPWSNVASSVFSGIVLTTPGDGELGRRRACRAGRVLDAGRGPQRTLLVGAGGEQRLRALGGELLLEQLVGELRVGDAGLALERERLVGADRVEALVDLGVDARHEERGDRVDRRQVDAGGLGLLEPGRGRRR